MPKDADPIKPQQIATLSGIKEGAKDVHAVPGDDRGRDAGDAVARPCRRSLFAGWHADGGEGYHEVLLDTSAMARDSRRLIGESSESRRSPLQDGKSPRRRGGGPAELAGQVWEVATGKNVKTFQPSSDSLYGRQASPPTQDVACGACGQRRRAHIDDGKIPPDSRPTPTGCLPLFTLDARTLVPAGATGRWKLIDVETALRR